MSEARPRARERFAANMRRLRQERGWSQEELAARAGMHRNYMSPLERAERNVGVDIMERLAEAFGVDLCDMLADSSKTP